MYLLIFSILILSLSIYFYIVAGSKYIEYKKIKERFDPQKQMPNIEIEKYKREEVKIVADIPNYIIEDIPTQEVFEHIKLRYSKQFMENYANLCGYDIDLQKDEDRTIVTVLFGVFTKY